MAYQDPNTKFYKSKDGAIISGVCSGLSESLKIDVTFIRILFVLFTFMGIGVFIYIILALVLPNKTMIINSNNNTNTSDEEDVIDADYKMKK